MYATQFTHHMSNYRNVGFSPFYHFTRSLVSGIQWRRFLRKLIVSALSQLSCGLQRSRGRENVSRGPVA
jgi:hypothetical protein